MGCWVNCTRSDSARSNEALITFQTINVKIIFFIHSVGVCSVSNTKINILVEELPILSPRRRCAVVFARLDDLPSLWWDVVTEQPPESWLNLSEDNFYETDHCLRKHCFQCQGFISLFHVFRVSHPSRHQCNLVMVGRLCRIWWTQCRLRYFLVAKMVVVL